MTNTYKASSNIFYSELGQSSTEDRIYIVPLDDEDDVFWLSGPAKSVFIGLCESKELEELALSLKVEGKSFQDNLVFVKKFVEDLLSRKIIEKV